SIVRKNVIGHLAFKFGQHATTNNHSVKLDRAFVTFDAQDYIPIFPRYFTIGQLFMPFGTYASTQLSESIISEIGKESGQVIKAGYKLHESLTGDFFVQNEKRKIGVDAKYHLTYKKVKLDVGLSFITKSEQTFKKGKKDKETKNVGSALFPFMAIEVNQIGIRTSLLTALSKKKIDRRLLASRLEGYYNFKIKGKFCSTGIGYDNLINKNIYEQPRYRINATFNTVFLPYTFSSFEIKYEPNNTVTNKKSIGASIRFGVAY
ncbi:MAG: hypothetical protein HRT87_08360, partial [Legionellales bacterium]|nr:hypothetical protein [Legionellales bacterium]